MGSSSPRIGVKITNVWNHGPRNTWKGHAITNNFTKTKKSKTKHASSKRNTFCLQNSYSPESIHVHLRYGCFQTNHLTLPNQPKFLPTSRILKSKKHRILNRQMSFWITHHAFKSTLRNIETLRYWWPNSGNQKYQPFWNPELPRSSGGQIWFIHNTAKAGEILNFLPSVASLNRVVWV